MIIAKRKYFDNYTKTSYLLPDGSQRYFLELPWRDNEIGKSCIKEGVYIVDRDYTGRQKYYSLRNDETHPRTHIEIHPASTLSHLQGCLAPCVNININKNGQPVAIDSLKATKELINIFGDHSWALKITS